MVALPGQPQSILIARGSWLGDNYLFSIASQDVAVYNDAVPRKGTLSLDVRSFYIQGGRGATLSRRISLDGLRAPRPIRRSVDPVFGWVPGHAYQFTVSADGVALGRSFLVPVSFSKDSLPTWNGSLLSDRAGTVVDVGTGVPLGRAAMGASGCALAPDWTGDTVLAAQADASRFNPPAHLVQYSLDSFRASGTVSVAPTQDFLGACDFASVVGTWGTDGIVISSYQHSGGGSNLVFLHASGFDPVTLSAPPDPVVDPSGVVRLAIPANDLAYDASRNLLWASVPGSSGQIGNTVISIDPASGRIIDSIFAGSEPGKLALATDASRLYVISQSVPTVTSVDLNAKQRSQTFSVLDDGNWTPVSVAPVPNQNNSFALVRISADNSTGSNIAIYDGGARRAQAVTNSGLTAIYPGNTPDSFYAADLQLYNSGATHDIARLVTSPLGITTDRKLNALHLGDTSHFGVQSANLVYDNGNLFTTGGEIWTPDAQILQGRFAIPQSSYAAGISVPAGIPVTFPDHSQVAYVYESDLTNTAAITLFDLTTFRPSATLPIPPSPTQSLPQLLAAVRAGSSTAAIAANGQILLVPLADLQPWPKYPANLQSVGAGIQRMDLPVNAIAALPGSSKLLLATASAAGDIGNSIVTFNPSNGQIESAVFAGSEPSLIAVTPDGSAVYTTLAGEGRVGRVNLSSSSRDLLFAPDPFGGSTQYSIYDMALGPDGGLALSYYGGGIAIFDNGVPRPLPDSNDQGPFAYDGAYFELAFNGTGTLLYAYDAWWSTFDFKRCAVSTQGVQWLSSANGLTGGHNTGQIRYAQGLLYTSTGDVIDLERSRRVGIFGSSTPISSSAVAPDPATGKIFFLSGSQILMFDINTRALLGMLTVPIGNTAMPQTLVRFGDEGLALSTKDIWSGKIQIFLTRVSAIPLLPAPVPSPQPSLPVTPGVTVVDLAAQDTAYDPSRNLIYASIPNSEAAQGDQIAAIDPTSGSVKASWAAGLNPRLLSLTDDQSRLYYTLGAATNSFVPGGGLLTSEFLRALDLGASRSGAAFPSRPQFSSSFYSIADIATLPGQPRSVGVIDFLSEVDNTTGIVYGLGPNSLRIYDDGSSRLNFLGPKAFSCAYLTAGATASRLYCSSGSAIARLAADAGGVTLLDSFSLPSGTGNFGHMVFSGGRIYTSTGVIADAEGKSVVGQIQAQGPVAVDGNLVYWLDASGSDPVNPSVVLRSFDSTTLQPVATKKINVTSTDLTRLIPCGQGRVAFRTGHEIYVVNP
jgi:hypothetical protein